MIRFSRHRPVRILLVEDNDTYAETIELLLADTEDIEVVARARDGVEGCRLATDLEPDCILMDISMPLMDGFAATEIISRVDPDVRIVMLTSSDDAHDRARALRAGASAYLTKESPLHELVSAATAGGAGNVRQLRPAVRRVVARGVGAPPLPTSAGAA